MTLQRVREKDIIIIIELGGSLGDAHVPPWDLPAITTMVYTEDSGSKKTSHHAVVARIITSWIQLHQ